MVNLDAHRAHDAEVVLRHQVVDRVHAARRAVFQRQHAVAAEALFNGGEHRLEGTEKERARALEQPLARLLGIRALHALTGDGGVLGKELRRLFDGLGNFRGQITLRAEKTALAAAAQLENEGVERGDVFAQVVRRFVQNLAHFLLLAARIEHAQAVGLFIFRDLFSGLHALGKERDELIVDAVDLFSIVV